jgi:hypothetical protein
MLNIRILVGALCLVLAVLPQSAAMAQDEKTLIWKPEKRGNAYAMRMGGRLSPDWDARAGTEVGFSGAGAPGRRNPKHPVKFWGSIRLPALRGKTSSGTSHITVQIDGLEGRRTVALNSSRSVALAPGLAARIEDVYALNHNPSGDGRVRARTAKTFRLVSTSTRTSVFASGTRSDTNDRWQAMVGIEQKVFKGVNLRADFNDVASENRTSRFTARYTHRW